MQLKELGIKTFYFYSLENCQCNIILGKNLADVQKLFSIFMTCEVSFRPRLTVLKMLAFSNFSLFDRDNEVKNLSVGKHNLC